jgi:DNA (cytosine-5)-methyltransferase 1
VQADLEAEGYEVQPYVLPAVSVNAPHRRDRVWFVAYSASASERANQLSGIRCQDGEVGREGSQTIHNAFRSDGIEGITSDTNSNGLNQCNSDNEVNTSEGGVNAFGDTNKSNGDGDVADTNLQRFNKFGSTFITNKQKRQYSKKNPFDRQRCWQNFPSVSPICTGDDGISDRLDSITFPKWRNESIKAGGNAIVPQVVLQIFKTIEQYERINTPDKNK